MDNIQLLTAAVTILEELQSSSTPGPWFGHQNILGVVRVKSNDGWIVAETFDTDHDATFNADLISTLRATLEPQRRILTRALNLLIAHGTEPNTTVLDLAQAILSRGWDSETD